MFLHHSLVLLLILLRLTTADKPEPSVCQETFGNERLPPMPTANFAVEISTISSIESNQQELIGQGHVTIAYDYAIGSSRKSSVTQQVSVDAVELSAIFDEQAGQILVYNKNYNPFNIAAGLRIEKGVDEQINGILATTYKACYYASNIRSTVEIIWWYPAGSSTDSTAPIRMQSRYLFGPDSNNDRKILRTVYIIEQLRQLADRHDVMRHPFITPRGVYCRSYNTTKKPPRIASRISFSIEEYSKNFPGLPSELNQPIIIRESYDQRGNLTLIEMDGLEFAWAKYGNGLVTRINDFARGLSYVKNQKFENCTFEKLPSLGWDISLSPNGPRIKSPDEFFLPSLNELQYKGNGLFRSIDVDIYVGYLNGTSNQGENPPSTIEYWLKSLTLNDGPDSSPITVSLPVAFYTASSGNFSLTGSAFDFNLGVPKVYDRYISSCFSFQQELHFEFRLSTSNLNSDQINFIETNQNKIVYSFVNSLAESVNISPLRVFNSKVTKFTNPLLLIEITLSERANVPGYTPQNPESQLNQIEQLLNASLSNGELKVKVTLNGGKHFYIPIEGFNRLDNRGVTKKFDGSILSTGGAVALSIGMLILGVFLTLGTKFGVAYGRSGRCELYFTWPSNRSNSSQVQFSDEQSLKQIN